MCVFPNIDTYFILFVISKIIDTTSKNDERIEISYSRRASMDQTALVLAVHFFIKLTSRPQTNSNGSQMLSENFFVTYVCMLFADRESET